MLNNPDHVENRQRGKQYVIFTSWTASRDLLGHSSFSSPETPHDIVLPDRRASVFLMSEVVVSAPGKVLLAGGYLVLDRAHTGLVFGLSARVYVHVKSTPPLTDTDPSLLVVRSPQFTNAEWRYDYSENADDGGIKLTQNDR